MRVAELFEQDYPGTSKANRKYKDENNKQSKWIVSVCAGPTAADITEYTVTAWSKELAAEKALALAKKDRLRSPEVSQGAIRLVKEGEDKAVGGSAPVKPSKSEGKAAGIAQLKKDYKNAMSWVNAPAMDLPNHERSKWEQQARKLKQHAKTQYGVDLSEAAFKVNDKVKIIGGPRDVVGKEGFIGEIRTDVGGKKTYTVDYDGEGTARAKSIMLPADKIKRMPK
jgi:hypothetical protein